MRSLRPLLIVCIPAVLVLAASGVHAQYQWKDENGRMVFSDQPPPMHIKPEQILRTDPRAPVPVSRGFSPTGERTTAENVAAGGSQGNTAKTTAAAGSRTPPPSAKTAAVGESVADKDLDAKRKAKEKADAERKRKEQAEVDAKLARACEDMRSETRALESGMRVARVNKQGETEFVDDDERAKRAQVLKREMQESCKSG